MGKGALGLFHNVKTYGVTIIEYWAILSLKIQ
jgi:hypothetical protein